MQIYSYYSMGISPTSCIELLEGMRVYIQQCNIYLWSSFKYKKSQEEKQPQELTGVCVTQKARRNLKSSCSIRAPWVGWLGAIVQFFHADFTFFFLNNVTVWSGKQVFHTYNFVSVLWNDNKLHRIEKRMELMEEVLQN